MRQTTQRVFQKQILRPQQYTVCWSCAQHHTFRQHLGDGTTLPGRTVQTGTWIHCGRHSWQYMCQCGCMRINNTKIRCVYIYTYTHIISKWYKMLYYRNMRVWCKQKIIKQSQYWIPVSFCHAMNPIDLIMLSCNIVSHGFLPLPRHTQGGLLGQEVESKIQELGLALGIFSADDAENVIFQQIAASIGVGSASNLLHCSIAICNLQRHLKPDNTVKHDAQQGSQPQDGRNPVETKSKTPAHDIEQRCRLQPRQPNAR